MEITLLITGVIVGAIAALIVTYGHRNQNKTILFVGEVISALLFGGSFAVWVIQNLAYGVDPEAVAKPNHFLLVTFVIGAAVWYRAASWGIRLEVRRRSH